MSTISTTSELDILADATSPDLGNMSAEAAQSVLSWKLSDRAISQMRTSLDRNNKGELTPPEQEEREQYRRIGMLIDLVQAKARISLKCTEVARQPMAKTSIQVLCINRPDRIELRRRLIESGVFSVPSFD